MRKDVTRLQHGDVDEVEDGLVVRQPLEVARAVAAAVEHAEHVALHALDAVLEHVTALARRAEREVEGVDVEARALAAVELRHGPGAAVGRDGRVLDAEAVIHRRAQRVAVVLGKPDDVFARRHVRARLRRRSRCRLARLLCIYFGIAISTTNAADSATTAVAGLLLKEVIALSSWLGKGPQAILLEEITRTGNARLRLLCYEMTCIKRNDTRNQQRTAQHCHCQ